jgi:hypothetical protein
MYAVTEFWRKLRNKEFVICIPHHILLEQITKSEMGKHSKRTGEKISYKNFDSKTWINENIRNSWS